MKNKNVIIILLLSLTLVSLVILLNITNVSAVTNISSCGTLNTAHEIYTLNVSLTATDTCLNITANNITIDGLDLYNITSNNSVGTGINASVAGGAGLNITVQNIKILNYTSSIYSVGQNGAGGDSNGAAGGSVILINSTTTQIDNFGGGGVQSGGNCKSGGVGGMSIIVNSNLTTVNSYGGPHAGGSCNPTAVVGGNVYVNNSNITTINAYTGSGDHGPSTAATVLIFNSNVGAINNYGNGGCAGCNPGVGGTVTATNSTLGIITASAGGVSCCGHTRSGGIITITNSNVTSIINKVGGGGSITILGEKINITRLYIDMNYSLGGNGEKGTLIINYSDSLDDRETSYSSIIFLRVINKSSGEIRWLNSLNGWEFNGRLYSNLTIQNNSAYIDSSNSALNSSANVTLFNLPTSLNNPAIVRNSIARCITSSNPKCSNFTSLNAGTVTFNVSSWSNYSIEEDDLTSPNIQFTSPTETNGSYLVRSNIVINITSSDTNLLNISIKLFNSTHNQINFSNSTSSPLFANYTGLSDGTYHFNATAFDTFDNQNTTERRTVIIDTTPPNVTIVSPTATTYTTDTIAINLTLSESGNCLYTINSGATNITLTNNSARTSFSGTSASLSNAAYLLIAYCNDTAGNTNYTQNVSFTISVSSEDGGGGGSGSGSGSGGGGGTPPQCIPEYSCSSWSQCTNGLRERSCVDTKCSTGTRTETSSCELELCESDWQCTSWSQCTNGISTRQCSDINNCNNDDSPIEETTCGIPTKENIITDQKEGCTPNVQCKNWGTCSYDGTVEEVLENNIQLTGSKKRICNDLNLCIPNYEESSSCTSNIQLKFEQKEVCGETNLIATNIETSNPASTINLESWSKNKLDVNFIQNSTVYCSTCYNGILDGAELGVDCGGDCKICKLDKNRLPVYIIWILWGVSIILLSALFYRKKDKIKEINDLIKKGKKSLHNNNKKKAITIYKIIRNKYSKLSQEDKIIVYDKIKQFHDQIASSKYY